MKSFLLLSLLTINIFAVNPLEYFKLDPNINNFRKLTDEERTELDEYYEKRRKASQFPDSNRSAKDLDLFREAPPAAR